MSNKIVRVAFDAFWVLKSTRKGELTRKIKHKETPAIKSNITGIPAKKRKGKIKAVSCL